MPDIFRPFFRTSEEKAAQRREQIRTAQRTYRERRDQYLKMLEQKVSRQVANEVRLRSEIHELQQGLTVAHQKLASLGVDVHVDTTMTLNMYGVGIATSSPDDHWTLTSPSSTSASESFTYTSVWLETRGDCPHQLHVQHHAGVHGRRATHHPSPSSDASLSPFGEYDRRDIASNDEATFQGAAVSNQHFLANLDMVQVAMEFVLKLEGPCLPHIINPSLEKDSLNGHVHTASAALLKSANCHPVLSHVAWKEPVALIKSLLTLSNELPIDGCELTPVQVWHHISRHANFQRLKMAEFNLLSDKLLKHIKCYGFGGVVKQDYLMLLLRETLI